MSSPSPVDNPVGIIGLGSLGLPVALNILKHDFGVVGYRRTSSSVFFEAGGEIAASIADVARRCDIVITCLPSSEALAEVVSGTGGLAEFARPETLVVDLGMHGVALKAAQQQALSRAGASMLDCGVSGNHVYVTDRSAALFASGRRTDYERCLPILDAITNHVTYVGAFGAGTTLKLIASVLVPIHTLAAAEALALASRAGIDLEIVLDAIKGTQASSAMFETRGARMARGNHVGPPLAGYYQRNIVAALELTRRLGGDYPLLGALDVSYRAAIAQGFGDLDQSAMFDFLLSSKSHA